MSISFSPLQILYQVCPDKLDIFLHLLPIRSNFPFHNPECQKSIVYTFGISYLFAFSAGALGLLANLKETRKVKRACQVEATSIKSVVNE
jgi:hypothetical protein